MTPEEFNERALKEERRRQRIANLQTAVGVLIAIAVAGFISFTIFRHSNQQAAACERAGGSYISGGNGECWDKPSGRRIFNF